MESRPVVAIIQARMGSSRLPGKVLMPLAGVPLLQRVVERARRARRIDSVVVATTDKASDDQVERLCRSLGVDVFRGSEEDVLDRYYQAARAFGARTVVRITADCPLLDPEIVDRTIQLYEDSGCDYATNTNPPTYPDGLDVEVFRFSALEEAWNKARKPSEREHVTGYIVHSGRFKTQNLRAQRDLSSHRWTVDEPQDYEFVRQVYELLQHSGPSFGTAEILELLEKMPHLRGLNSGFERNEGLKKSLKKDEEFLRGQHA